MRGEPAASRSWPTHLRAINGVDQANSESGRGMRVAGQLRPAAGGCGFGVGVVALLCGLWQPNDSIYAHICACYNFVK